MVDGAAVVDVAESAEVVGTFEGLLEVAEPSMMAGRWEMLRK